MSTRQRTIALYIHPDTGPITPMLLDLMAVEMVALSVPSTHHDDARAREIARLITKSFPKVDPHSAWRQVTSISGRLSSADIFNGIVLRLPGTIEGPAVTASTSTLDELKKLTHEVEQLKDTRKREQQEHNELKAQAYSLHNENKRLKMLYEKSNNEGSDLRLRAQQIQDEAKRAQILVDRANRRADKAEQELATQQATLEMAHKELQKRSEAEYFALRQKVKNADKAEEQLRATIVELEQKLSVSRERIRLLTEGPLEDKENSELSLML